MAKKKERKAGWYVSPTLNEWLGYWNGNKILYGVSISGEWFSGDTGTVNSCLIDNDPDHSLNDKPASQEEVLKRLKPIMDGLGLIPGVDFKSPTGSNPVFTIGDKFDVTFGGNIYSCKNGKLQAGALLYNGIWATPVAAEKPMMEFIADNSVKEFKKYQWYKTTMGPNIEVKAMYWGDGIGCGEFTKGWSGVITMRDTEDWELMSHNEIIYFLGNMFSQIYGSSSAVWLDSKKTKKGFVSRKALNLMVGYGEATLTCGGGADAITVFDKGIWLEPVVKKMFKNEPIEESEELGKLREDMVDSLLNEFFPDSVTGTTDVNTDELFEKLRVDKTRQLGNTPSLDEITKDICSIMNKPTALKIDHQNKILEIFYKICNLRRNASVEECMVDAINAFEFLIKRIG